MAGWDARIMDENTGTKYYQIYIYIYYISSFLSSLISQSPYSVTMYRSHLLRFLFFHFSLFTHVASFFLSWLSNKIIVIE